MKFMLTFNWKPTTAERAEGIARFQKTGGLPPKGATLLGRWTRADFSAGYDLIESDDAQALAEFALLWSDLMHIEYHPVLEDQALAEVLQRIAK
ncbi:MAG TPA: DUF3303 family protein [Thermoanaerobaculia bacterium]|nr:DUF3303 family protein [Thermoanaerobaculia bacterium]